MALDSYFVSWSAAVEQPMMKPILIGVFRVIGGVVVPVANEARSLASLGYAYAGQRGQLCPEALIIRGDFEEYSLYKIP